MDCIDAEDVTIEITGVISMAKIRTTSHRIDGGGISGRGGECIGICDNSARILTWLMVLMREEFHCACSTRKTGLGFCKRCIFWLIGAHNCRLAW